MVERWNSPWDSSSRCPNIGFQWCKKVPNPPLFSPSSRNPFSQLLVLILFFHLQPPAPLYHAVLSQQPSIRYLIPSPLAWSRFSTKIPFTDMYANDSRCVSVRVPKSERISPNERLLTVGKNYLNWNWSFHRPSRRLLYAASSYPPSCRSIPSKSE